MCHLLVPTSKPHPLVEKFLLSDAKGAVATFSPTGFGVGTGHDYLAEGFYDLIFVDGNWDLGAASLSAKANLFRIGGFYDLIMTYSVFGDPALRLKSPYSLSASPETGSGEQTSGYSRSYAVTVTNTSPVEDSFLVSVSGNDWQVSVPSVVGPVAAGGQTSFQVVVQVPEDAAPGETDQVLVTIKSKGDRAQVDQATFTTTANVYGAEVAPEATTSVLLPGSSVVHTVTITNTSNKPDAFSLSINTTDWANSVSPATTPLLNPGQSTSASVTIRAPADAVDYETNALQLSVSSQADPRKTSTANFTTVARYYGVEVRPEFCQPGRPGRDASHVHPGGK